MTAAATRREILLTQALLAVTALGVAPAMVQMAGAVAYALVDGRWADAAAAAVSLVVIACVSYGVVVHHVARVAWLRRSLREAPRPAVASGGSPASLTILVPSFKEEARVVRRTLLSAALQTYRRRRLVLLIDDPPRPEDVESSQLLAAARRLPDEIEALLRPMRGLCEREAAAFRGDGAAADCRRLAALLAACAGWYRERAAEFERGDHGDRFFARAFLGAAADDLERDAAVWRVREAAGADAIAREVAALTARFTCEVEAFERKRYVNLSHEPNKAMNLNAYLGLLGGCYREVGTAAGAVLERCAPADAQVRATDSELVLFLDADTVILPHYAARMVELLQSDGNERVAVAQTPYSAFPDAPGDLERIAGATTDVQYLLHVGMTELGAGFWVGANAVARVDALRDVAITDDERGWPVRKFLHDRTVIEDTETTLQLRRRGWSVISHPERLAFSATPADFGSLLVQRLRWADGGLMLVPSLWRALRLRSPSEAAMRLHYLVSLGPTSLALLALPFCFFGGRVDAGLLPLMAVSYLGLYARDLVRCGYSAADVVRVYALNLLLIPVNLWGLFHSLRQAMTGRKPRFVRTPKVETRTPTPGICVVAQTAMLSFWLAFAVHIGMEGSVLRAGLVMMHVALLGYAVARFIGWRAAVGDFLDDARAGVVAPDEGPAAVEGWAESAR